MYLLRKVFHFCFWGFFVCFIRRLLGKACLTKIANRNRGRSQATWTTVLGIQLGGEINPNPFLLGISLALGCKSTVPAAVLLPLSCAQADAGFAFGCWSCSFACSVTQLPPAILNILLKSNIPLAWKKEQGFLPTTFHIYPLKWVKYRESELGTG